MFNVFLFRPSVTLLVICLALLFISAVIDIKYKIIPNGIVLVVLVLGLSFNLINSAGLGLKQALFGLGGGLFIMLPVYLLKGWGAGDVKLMAALGSVVGLDKIIDIIFYSVLLMGLMSVVFIMSNVLFCYSHSSFKNLAIRQIPMAPAIAVATFYVLMPALGYSAGFFKSWP